MNVSSLTSAPQVATLPGAAAAKTEQCHHSHADHVELGTRRKTILLQIDGLGYNVLKQAMEKGLAPNIARYMQQNAAALQPFMCGIPAETIPVLTSLFYGQQIPANDWWSKEKMAMVDATTVEREIAAKALSDHGEKGLTTGGRVISAPIAGGADNARLTPSKMHESSEEHGKWKTIAKETWENFKLVWRGDECLVQMLWQTGKDILSTRSDLKQSGQWNTWWDQHYPIMLALSKNVFPVVATEGVKKAIDENAPVAYVDFTDYDEAGHYYGCKSERAMQAVENIDGHIGEILDHARGTDYEVIIFSDHGQTDSTPFKKKYGQNLDEIIDAHISQVRGDARVPADEVVCAHAYSMNNVYFNFSRKTEGEAEIEKRYPGMIDKLASHPGIGLVVARRGDGLIMRGPEGSLEMVDGQVRVSGKNPLERYGDPAIIAEQIRTYAAVPQTGDLLVFAVYDQEKDHTYDFGEKYTLKALHGGLGGDQGLPFMLAPNSSGVDLRGTITAIQLHEKVAHQNCRI